MNGNDYRTLREAVGVVSRDDLTVFRMWGRDPTRMLNGLITNDLSRASETRAVYAAMLTPKGKIIADLRAFPVGTAGVSEILLELPTSASSAAADHLKKYVPPLFAKWEKTDRRVVGVFGPRASEVIRAVFDLAPDPTEDSLALATLEDEAVAIVSTALAGHDAGYDIFVPSRLADPIRRKLTETASPLGGGEIGFAALEAARIEAGRPRFGIDFSDENLPAEVFESTGLMGRTVSFSKGCYTGQEVVVRIAHRGHANRSLRGILLGSAPAPAPTTTVRRPDTAKEIGWTTSAAESPLLEQTIALAYVRREIQPGDRVLVGEQIGTVTTLPFHSP